MACWLRSEICRSILTLALAIGWWNSVAAAGEETSLAKAGEKSYRQRWEELRKERTKRLRAAGRPQGDTSGAKPSESVDVTYVDEMLTEEWKALGFGVAGECKEGEFVRRASLDIIGRIPTLEETQAFLHDNAPDRKQRLIDRLLATEEYGKNFATIWTKLLMPENPGDNNRLNPQGMHAWLEKEFNRNTPWNEMVTELLTANGRWNDNGAVNFVVANMQNGTVDLTANVTRIFLCVQTQCTQCHDHPWNEWKQEQFHGMNSFFLGTDSQRVTKVNDNGQQVTDYYEVKEIPYRELPEPGTFYERRSGEQFMARPTYLDGRDLMTLVGGKTSEFRVLLDDEEESEDEKPVYLRQQLAKVITSPDNGYFARAIVNRMWHHYMGHSFIKNVDDFDNGQDEPTMPDLLDKLAADFCASGYDLKALSRWICNSKAYSLSSIRPGKDNEDAVGFFTFMLMKPLTAEQLYDSVMTLTRAHEVSANQNTAETRRAFIAEFKRTFGDDEGTTTAPKYNGTITQSLMMMNSPVMDQCTQCAPGSFLHGLATDPKLTPMEKAETLYMAALSRQPTGAERKEIQQMINESGPDGVPAALSDVLWVLLNSAEFVLNH